jgi:hypothetical protein
MGWYGGSQWHAMGLYGICKCNGVSANACPGMSPVAQRMDSLVAAAPGISVLVDYWVQETQGPLL